MLRTAIVTGLFLAVLSALPCLDAWGEAAAQQAPAPGTPLVPGAACVECNQLAESLLSAKATLDYYHGEHEREVKEELDDEILAALRSQAQTVMTQAALMRARFKATGDQAYADRAKILDAELDALAKAINSRLQKHRDDRGDLERPMREALDRVLRLERELAECNAKCPKSGDKQPQPHSQDPATACAACGDLTERIKAVEADLEALAERINTIQNLQEELEQLKSKGGTPSQQSNLQSQIDQVNRNHQDTVKQEQEKSAELERLHKQLKECTSKCTPKQASSIMRGPIPYLAGGGAAAAALLAGGGGDSSAGTLATPSPQAQQPPQQPQTPQQPQPPSRQPAGTQNVIGCQCIDNSAALDGIAQLCQRLRVIRAQSSGMSITLTGDAPLPTFQGTFNQTTGAFELAATTMLGSIASNTVIAGTVETNGTLGNLRISFSNASGRLTLYNLTTAVGP